MDTSRITQPLERLPLDRLPAAGAAIVSTVGDVTSNLADQIADHLSDIDVDDTVRRSRRTIATVIPWMTTPRSPRSSKRWIVFGGLVAAVVVVVLLRRRAATSSETPAGSTGAGSTSRSTNARGDWTTVSANGSAPEVERDLESTTNG